MRGNNYTSNSRGVFDVNDLTSFADNFSRLCIRICYQGNLKERGEMCVSNPNSMVLDPETLFSKKWGFGPLSGVGGILC